ncbi:cryptochrome/photolyase family protein [Salipiger mangrovisoli]|uniref:Deoxyribodipyrimidine photo-lyase n=1 Tax=Salipiger mangrovisoli TaxID=2865933 RepID=A0ABR9X3K5_9RHOB|nr:deoxyribodipyrimidine photo-lyase [Salipiger mangrovisoli]MBE9638099.1 deoxyribodipyrimidine photo-lyase [Salipiger mangrovisoli]
MADVSPTLLWIRRDLRLSDHAALSAAVARGGPVIPVFVRDHTVDALGAAPKWRLEQGLEAFIAALEEKGSRLILRAGPAREVIPELVRETGAGAVYWQRAYDPASVARDTDVKSDLRAAEIAAESFSGHLLFEPWSVETKQGAYYKVYSPYWRAVKDREVAAPVAAPAKIPVPRDWPESAALADWHLGAAMNRGATVLSGHVLPGEAAAQARLGTFMRDGVAEYGERRDRLDQQGTSRMSEYLSLGEISPARCWHAGLRAQAEGKAGAGKFLSELAWREFAYHLMWHTPHILEENWREEWRAFPWKEDRRLREVRLWEQARTGMAVVDAALREMYVTGYMHNRARMIVASYLTKHLMVHWRIGQAWFDDCLIDWDPAANAMGWQWVAGCGPDAAPYFRVFNPETQAEKFDPEGAYRRTWIAEGQAQPPQSALDYFAAVPRSWQLDPAAEYPAPVVSAQEGRAAALAAYEQREF